MKKNFGWLFAMVALLFVGAAYADDAVEASNDEVVVAETQDEQQAEEVAVADEAAETTTEE